MKKRNPIDATRRDICALKKRVEELERLVNTVVTLCAEVMAEYVVALATQKPRKQGDA